MSYLRFQLCDFQVQLVQMFVHKGDERLMTRQAKKIYASLLSHFIFSTISKQNEEAEYRFHHVELVRCVIQQRVKRVPLCLERQMSQSVSHSGSCNHIWGKTVDCHLSLAP